MDISYVSSPAGGKRNGLGEISGTGAENVWKCARRAAGADLRAVTSRAVQAVPIRPAPSGWGRGFAHAGDALLASGAAFRGGPTAAAPGGDADSGCWKWVRAIGVTRADPDAAAK